MKKHYLNELVDKFEFEGELTNSKDHICGHINDTYILDFKQSNGEVLKYILQKINTSIFKEVDELMNNIGNITFHIKEKVKLIGGNPLRETLNIIPTKDDRRYYKHPSGECWRVFSFIDNASTYDKVEDPEVFYSCGKALGKFQNYLSDFKAERLFEIIPDFHNTPKRFITFKEAIENNKSGRVDEVKEEIDFILNRGEEMKILLDLVDKGEIPIRVTHNDTKFNNIMIDDITGEGVAVIDLDTVMPGLALYDFGDAIRSGATTALEDEADLSKVNFDMELYKRFTEGYLQEVGSVLTEAEIKYLPFSAKLITLELAMRFLTDHIDGDVYFKVHKENHNLDRARNQLKLVKDMEEKEKEMKAIVQNCLK